MKRTWTGLLAAVLSVGCVTGLEDGSTDDHGMEITISGGDLRSTFALVDGYFESPVMAVPEGATRVAAMLTLTDVPLEMDGRLEARVVRDDGTLGAWLPLSVTFNEEELRVIKVDLGEQGGQVQLRVMEPDADLISMITWSAGIPEQEDLADDGDISAVTNGSETQQGLDGALANAGVLPRSAWGARPTRCTSRDRAKERMAIHHTAGAPTAGGSYEAALRQIQAYHMDGRGYCDAGYHFAVTLDGRTWELRPLTYLGGHSRSYNGGNAGIVLVGCFDSAACAGVSGPRTLPDAMVAGAGRVVKTLSGMFNIAINTDRIKGHGQQPYQQTGCPGDGGRARLEDIRSAARNGSTPAPQPQPPPPSGECGQVRVNTTSSALNIRPTASTAGSPVGSLQDGATVTRLSSVQGQSVNGDRTWHRIRTGSGVTGYISGAYARCVAGSPQASTPAPAAAPAGCGFVGPGQALAPNQAVTSCDGRFTLAHQGDGNVVLYQGGAALWSSQTPGRATDTLVMQEDGNLVLYAPGGVALWNSRTAGNPGATLAVQNDGNTVIYAPGNRAVFATGTAGR